MLSNGSLVVDDTERIGPALDKKVGLKNGSALFADALSSVTQPADATRPSPSGGRFAVRPCHADFVCVVIRSGDSERGGGRSCSGSKDGTCSRGNYNKEDLLLKLEKNQDKSHRLASEISSKILYTNDLF